MTALALLSRRPALRLALRPVLAALAATGALLMATPAHALFADDEARQAILDLRARVEAQRQLIEAQRTQIEQQAGAAQRASDDGAQLRRSLLDLQQQIEALRAELAKIRGTDEQLARDLSELQRRQKDVAQGVDERLRRFEPVKVTVDGREFMADPAEQKEFEAALAVMRKGDFAAAGSAFGDFLRRHPQSGYRGSALFWQGNAQYATRDYNGAIASFRALLQAAPEHARAPESVLSIANCQIELKQVPAAKRTLDELIKAYPQSEAAATARERLPRLK